jgi:acetolactate synthase-1/2/3 large subunit
MVSICRTITKYAVLVTDPYRIRFELQKAVAIARAGRPGPVLVDIPDDLQRMDIDTTRLAEYAPIDEDRPPEASPSTIAECVSAIKQARRPVLIFGWGIHLAGAEDAARKLARITNVPVAMTWAALDILPGIDPLAIGGFGTHGVRFANFAVQNADLVLSIGSRLDTKATGTPPATFAREAKIMMVDIDPAELGKFKKLGVNLHLAIQAEAKAFIEALLVGFEGEKVPDRSSWLAQIADWKRRYPACLPSYASEKPVNPYWFVNKLSEALGENEIIFSDTGCALAWMMQAFEFKKGQRFYHAFNNTPMGYGLPAAMGAAFARPGVRIICISGDGSLQMNIQELATIAQHKLPVKILLINNHGHSMVQQTQEMWLQSNYYATSIKGGLSFPDFVAVARAYGFPSDTIDLNADIPEKLERMLAPDGPYFLNVEIDSRHRVIPQVKFGRPNEDADPLLGRDEFLANMLVKPMPVSLKQ